MQGGRKVVEVVDRKSRCASYCRKDVTFGVRLKGRRGPGAGGPGAGVGGRLGTELGSGGGTAHASAGPAPELAFRELGGSWGAKPLSMQPCNVR